MDHCETCRHWLITEDDRYSTVLFPHHPGSFRPMKTEAEVVAVFGHLVRRCRHPKVLFYQRPDRDGAAVFDGSEYAADLLTGERFGCVLHEGE